MIIISFLSCVPNLLCSLLYVFFELPKSNRYKLLSPTTTLSNFVLPSLCCSHSSHPPECFPVLQSPFPSCSGCKIGRSVMQWVTNATIPISSPHKTGGRRSNCFINEYVKVVKSKARREDNISSEDRMLRPNLNLEGSVT